MLARRAEETAVSQRSINGVEAPVFCEAVLFRVKFYPVLD